MCSKLPAGYRLHETQCQLVHMELNRHPRGHNRIEYEQISDEKKNYFQMHKIQRQSLRKMNLNRISNSYLMQSITQVLTKTGAGLILNNCVCIK